MKMAQKNVLKYIILGLLAHRELAGYDIKKLFEKISRDFFAKFSELRLCTMTAIVFMTAKSSYITGLQEIKRL